MKKNLNFKVLAKQLILASFLMFSFTGCDKDKDDDKVVADITLSVQESLSVSSQKSEYTVNILSNVPWTAKSNVDWITFEATEGVKGKTNLKFTVEKNTGNERTGTVTVSGTGGHEKSFDVIQETGLSTDMYVKEGGTGDGSSWANATTLSNALELVPSGSTVYIAAGTYIPTKIITNGNPDDASDKTFEISKYITLKGGFPKNPSNGATADPKANTTLLSGNLGGGIESYHVVTVTAPKIEGQKVVIEGVTISHGNGFDRGSKVTINGIDFARGNGGGMIIGNSIVDLINTDIVDNKTSGSGGTAGHCAGVFIFGESFVTVRDSKINDNISSGNGGGIWVDRSIAHIYNSEVNRNSGGTAAGVHGYPDAEVHMYNSSVSENTGTSYGGGFYMRQNSKGVLVNCLITGNVTTTKNGGGGIMLYNNSSLDLISSTVTGNKIENGPGGGIYRRLNVNPVNIYNSIISGNKQLDDGPDVDVYEENADAPLIQSSVIESKAYDQSGSVIADANFDYSSMLNSNLLPVGNNNPALQFGMSGADLTTLGGTFVPTLDDVISSDIKGNSRASSTIMGALVK